MVNEAKKAVLLVNLGTPDSPKRYDVYRYLKQFLLDRRVIDINPISRNLLVRGIIAPFRSKPTGDLYKELWMDEGSPLKVYGERLRDGVQAHLGEDYVVELAMRYQNPSIEAALEKVLANSPKSLTILPLFPQYTSACNGSVYEEVNRILAKKLAIPKVNFISSFHDYEPMIDVFVKRAKQYDIESYDHILFSYHGLPVRQMVKTDPGNHCGSSEDCCKTLTLKNQYCYSAQCYDTTYHIAEKLGLTKEQYSICFQSRLGRAPWLQPYTSDMIEHWAEKGVKRLLVFCPAFVADCLETTIEVSVEYQEEFEEMGGEHIQLVEGLNDHPDWIKAVAKLVKENTEMIPVSERELVIS